MKNSEWNIIKYCILHNDKLKNINNITRKDGRIYHQYERSMYLKKERKNTQHLYVCVLYVVGTETKLEKESITQQ